VNPLLPSEEVFGGHGPFGKLEEIHGQIPKDPGPEPYGVSIALIDACMNLDHFSDILSRNIVDLCRPALNSRNGSIISLYGGRDERFA